MSSPARRAELAKIFEEQQAKHAKERARQAALTMWERIEEADDIGAIKEILHHITQHLGLE